MPEPFFVDGQDERGSAVTDLARVRRLQSRLGRSRPHDVIGTTLREAFPGRVAVVSSFGADSAVLLHMIAAIDPATPVLFIDTGRHFAQTLAYRDLLASRLGLTNLRTIGPSKQEVARHDADNTRAAWDPDGCCAFRKTEPLKRALADFDAWITGRKRFQTIDRARLPVFEADPPHVKINPLAGWTAADIASYAREHNLPPHPLVAQGFLSIGCAPCTTAVQAGEDARAGRWRSLGKTECGIHLPHPAGN